MAFYRCGAGSKSEPAMKFAQKIVSGATYQYTVNINENGKYLLICDISGYEDARVTVLKNGIQIKEFTAGTNTHYVDCVAGDVLTLTKNHINVNGIVIGVV